MSNKIQIDIEVNGKMTKATVDAKELRGQLDGVNDAQKKATTSGDKFKKGLKGVGEQSANASKNFSKFSSGMGGFVGVYASLAAQLFAVSAAFNFLKRAGDLEALKAGQIAYASATGTAMRTLTSEIQSATDQQISFQDAAQAGAIGTAAGLTAAQMTKLGTAAADASQVLGRDVTDSFNRLVRGVTKAEPELLDELGIILRLSDASADYAEKLGKLPSQLTQAEKSQAVVNDVLSQAERKYSAVLDVVGRTPNQFSQLGIAFDNIQNRIKEVISVVAGPLAKVLTNTPILAGAGFALLAAGPLKAMGFSLKGLAENAKESADIQVTKLEELKQKEQELLNSKEAAGSRLKDLAAKEVKEAKSKSKILQRLAAGEKLIPVDKANLRKALKAAEGNINEHGIITAGIFKDRDATILTSFRATLDQMDDATDQSASRWQRATLKMRLSWRTFVGGVQRGVARITSAISKVTLVAGILGIALTGLKTGVEILKSRGIIPDDTSKELDKQAILAEAAEKRLSSLAKEYENFAKVQTVLMSETESTFTALVQGGGALGQMLSTVFAKDNVPTLSKNLKVYNKELAELTAYQAKRGAFAEKSAAEFLAMSTIMIQLGKKEAGLAVFGEGVARTFTDAIAGVTGAVTAIFGGADAGAAAIKTVRAAVYETAAETENFFIGIAQKFGYMQNATKNVTGISDIGEAAKKNLENVKDALKVYKDELEDRGQTGSSLFGDFDEAIKSIDKIAEGTKLTEKEQDHLNTTLDTGVSRAAAFAANTKAWPDAVKATASAFAQLKQKLLGSTAGDGLRKAAAAQLLIAEALEREIGVTDESTKLREELTNQIKLGTELATQENKKKIEGLKLQQEAIRNYSKISKAEGDLLKKSDQVEKSKTAQLDIQERQGRLQEMFTTESGVLNKEAQRKYDLLQAQYNLEDARLKLIKQEVAFLNANKSLFEGQERLQNIIKIMNFEKQAADFAIKTSKTLLDTAKLRAETARDQSQESFDAASNPFFDEQRAAAQFAYDQAVAKEAVESRFIERERLYKRTQINMDFKLLDAKNKQTIIEAKLLKARMSEKKELFTPADIAAVDSVINGLNNMNLEGQRAAMLENADEQAKRAQYQLEKGVRDAGRKLEQESPFNRVFNGAVASFRSSLGDAINTIFDSLSDKSIKLGDALREIGISFLQTIQEAVTEEFIVQPIMSSLGKFMGKEDPAVAAAAAMTTAHTTGATSITTAITSGADDLKTKISSALAEGVKICCCEAASPASSITEDTTTGLKTTNPVVEDSYSARTLETKTRNSIVDAQDSDYMKDLKEGLPSLSESVMQDNATPVNLPSETTPPLLELPPKTKTFFGNLFGKEGKLGKMFGNLFGEGGSLGKLFNSFKGGFSGIFDNLLGSFGSMFGDLFGSLGSLFGGGGAGGGGLLSGFASMIPGIGPVLGGAMSLFGFKNGGIMNNGKKMQGYADGGIANGSKNGHLAMLHGKEAVVPLPNGNSIPVEMKGAGNAGIQNNNVTVNVSTDGGGQTQSSSNGAMGENLGQAVAAAVQKELQNQKRAGGILNPMGAS